MAGLLLEYIFFTEIVVCILSPQNKYRNFITFNDLSKLHSVYEVMSQIPKNLRVHIFFLVEEVS